MPIYNYNAPKGALLYGSAVLQIIKAAGHNSDLTAAGTNSPLLLDTCIVLMLKSCRSNYKF